MLIALLPLVVSKIIVLEAVIETPLFPTIKPAVDNPILPPLIAVALNVIAAVCNPELLLN